MFRKFVSLIYWNCIYRRKPSRVGKKDKKLLAIFNGPSSNAMMDSLIYDVDNKNDIHGVQDILMVNRIILNKKEIVFKIRPEIYCLIDPAFWRDEKLRSEIVEVLEGVCWEMTLVTTQLCDMKVVNPNINVLYLSCAEISDNFPGLFTLYKNNKCVPAHQNVAISALYFGIMMGYKKIDVWGLDYSNMFKLRVDIDNQIFIDEEHSYCKNHTFVINTNMRQELANEKKVFDGFYTLKKFAEYSDANVINWCPQSYVDVFDKRDIQLD